MIKRALGVWAAGGGGLGAEDTDDSDEELTAAERQTLERRLLPGTKKAKKVPVAKPKPSADSDEESGSDGGGKPGWNSSDTSEEEEFSDIEDPVMPPDKAEDKPIRGKFQCQLCPDKILMNEKLLEAHLQSASHKKNERRFEEAKALGAEGYEARCRERAKAREALANGSLSKKAVKNEAYWEKKRKKGKRKEKRTKEKESELTKEEIEERKQRFQAKKARRAKLKEANGADVAATSEGPASGNRKARRQAAQAPAAAAAAEAQPRNRKERRLALQAAFAGKKDPAVKLDAAAVVGKKKKKRKHEAA